MRYRVINISTQRRCSVRSIPPSPPARATLTNARRQLRTSGVSAPTRLSGIISMGIPSSWRRGKGFGSRKAACRTGRKDYRCDWGCHMALQRRSWCHSLLVGCVCAPHSPLTPRFYGLTRDSGRSLGVHPTPPLSPTPLRHFNRVPLFHSPNQSRLTPRHPLARPAPLHLPLRSPQFPPSRSGRETPRGVCHFPPFPCRGSHRAKGGGSKGEGGLSTATERAARE